MLTVEPEEVCLSHLLSTLFGVNWRVENGAGGRVI